MLSRPKLLGVFFAQPADNRERSQLRLLGEPTLNHSDMAIKLGRTRTLVLQGRWVRRCVARGSTTVAILPSLFAKVAAVLSGTAIDAIAEFVLSCTNLGQ